MKKKLFLAALIAVTALAGCGESETEASSPVIIDVSAEPIQGGATTGKEDTTVGEEAPGVVLPIEKGEMTEKPWQTYTGPATAIANKRVEKDGKMQSYLTGEWKDTEVVKRRAMAVMIPDNTPALPQYGLSQASIVYEAPVEGRFTRLMGFFEDYDALDRIGPVRSSRDYYIHEAMSFDAIYCNWGLARPWVEELINSDAIDNVSQAVAGINNAAPEAFGRVSRPGYALEFTGYLLVPGYNQAVKRLKYDTEYDADHDNGFRFAEDDCWATYPLYNDAKEVWPGGKGNNSGGYGNYGENNVHFEYNEEDGLYYRYQYGDKHIDEYNKEQIKVRNIIFKICYGEERVPDDPKYDYLYFNTYGTGDAYIFTNGKCVKATWSRESEHTPTIYKDEFGDEIILNQGKTWICDIWKEYSDNIYYK